MVRSCGIAKNPVDEGKLRHRIAERGEVLLGVFATSPCKRVLCSYLFKNSNARRPRLSSPRKFQKWRDIMIVRCA